MLNQIITSQDFIDADIVAAKIEAGDFEVQVSPAFEVDGQIFRVLLDGHHSLAAAIEAGVEPDFIEQTASDNDRISLLNRGDIEGFLEVCWMDRAYHFAASGKAVW